MGSPGLVEARHWMLNHAGATASIDLRDVGRDTRIRPDLAFRREAR